MAHASRGAETNYSKILVLIAENRIQNRKISEIGIQLKNLKISFGFLKY